MTVKDFNTIQLDKIHQGKVRDSFKINAKTRMIITTDRLSCFDEVLETSLPSKGAILNEIANFWFSKTQNIIQNHMLNMIHPNVVIVKEAEPIKIEMIVRQYLTGSLWRKYKNGERTFCGVTIPDGMQQNERFKSPIVTPTTKEASDRNISPEEIVKANLATEGIYQEMRDIALKLFAYGQSVCKEKNLVLVDTKYEFGIIDNKLCLIDEIHTPDSSRFWLLEDYEDNPNTVTPYDKEYIRLWLLDNSSKILPKEIIEEALARYQIVHKRLTNKDPIVQEFSPVSISQSLIQNNIIKPGYVSIILGSKTDLDHALKIKKALLDYPVMVELRVVSAHKNGEDIIPFAKRYNNTTEPGVVIAIAGRSNGLGGALSANLAIPVISCPPFKDHADLQVNIFSSVMMPSDTPALFCVDTTNAAHAALRALNVPHLKSLLIDRIAQVKKSLQFDDLQIQLSTDNRKN
jgi:fusion protein PurCD